MEKNDRKAAQTALAVAAIGALIITIVSMVVIVVIIASKEVEDTCTPDSCNQFLIVTAYNNGVQYPEDNLESCEECDNSFMDARQITCNGQESFDFAGGRRLGFYNCTCQCGDDNKIEFDCPNGVIGGIEADVCYCYNDESLRIKKDPDACS